MLGEWGGWVDGYMNEWVAGAMLGVWVTGGKLIGWGGWVGGWVLEWMVGWCHVGWICGWCQVAKLGG